MEANTFLSNRYKKLGGIMLFPFAMLGVTLLISRVLHLHLSSMQIVDSEGITETSDLLIRVNYWLDDIVILGLTVALVLLGFSAERDENQETEHIRVHSLVWATFVFMITLPILSIFVTPRSYLLYIRWSIIGLVLLFNVIYYWKLYHYRLLLFRKHQLERKHSHWEDAVYEIKLFFHVID